MDGIDVDGAFERFRKRESKRFERDGFGGTREFAALDSAWRLVDRLAAHIPDQLDKPTPLNLLLRDLDPHELALVVVASLMHSGLVGREDPEMTIDLGKAVHELAFETKVLRPEKMGHKKARAAMEVGYRSKEWLIETEVQAGNALLDFCLNALGDVFQLTRGKKGVKAVRIPDSKVDEAVDIYAGLIAADLVLVPRKSPPKPWSSWRKRGHGDARERASTTFITGAAAYNKDTQRTFAAAFRDGSMKQHLDGMHALESVPYRINEPVLEALRNYYPEMLEEKFHRKQLRLEAKRNQLAASGASYKAMYWINSQIKAHARQLKQDKLQLKADLATADRFKGAPFYIELRCDFRGRVYPVPYFNYQRGDNIRSLFLFERGEPMGSEQAVRRLKDYAASCWGHGWDKKTLPERRHWVDDNWSRLIEPTAALKSKEWFKAENPFLFLAACIELVAVHHNGLSHITHLPISFDGLANGLVHYCCLTRQDPIGLLAANTTATPAVDPYRLVAEAVNPDNPDRALAKHPTGTFFYGATDKRRAKQIEEVLEDRDDVSLPSDPSEAAKLYYSIGEDRRNAIEGLFPGAKETMKFLQEIARELARHSNKPLQFTTPSGFLLINLYEKPEYKTVSSVLRGVRVRRKTAIGNRPGKIMVRKSKNAAAANVIHSLDAAHLMRAGIACRAAGIDIMGIHDCYVGLAPPAERLNGIIRQELIRMYDGRDYLTEIRDEAIRIAAVEKKSSAMADALSKHPLAKRVAKAVGAETFSFPKVPLRGSFDLREIIDNVYIFSS